MAKTAVGDTFFVDLRLLHIEELPASEPNIRLDITTAEGAKWSTGSCISFDGNAYIGSWSTLQTSSPQITFKLIELAPGLSCKGGAFTVNNSLDITALQKSLDVESGGATEWEDTVLELTSDYTSAIDKFDALIETTAEAAVDRVENWSEHHAAAEEDGKDTEATAAADTTNISKELGDSTSLQVMVDIEAPASAPGGDSKAVTTTTDKGAAPDGALQTQESTVHLYSSKSVYLHLAYRLRTEPKDYHYARSGLSMEQDIEKLGPGLHSYAHGGFMGLAISGVLDPKWRDIMKKEDPNGYRAAKLLSKRLNIQSGFKPTAVLNKYMTALENSPILVAMGLTRSGCTVPFSKQPQQPAPDASTTVKTAVQTTITTTSTAPSTPIKSPSSTQEQADTIQPPSTQEMSSNITTSPTKADASKARQLVEETVGRYTKSMQTPNRYGYLPAANEWDIWVHPTLPASLPDATINHGNQTALVMQTITTAVPGLKSCARKAGASQILSNGLSPIEWINIMGSSLNTAVNGDRNVPLELHGEVESWWRMHIKVDSVQGFDLDHWGQFYAKIDVDSDEVVLPMVKTSHAQVETASFKCQWPDEPPAVMWPLSTHLHNEDVILEVRGNPKGIGRNKLLGAVRVQLEELAISHPELLQGVAVTVPDIALGPEVKRRVWLDRGAKWEDDEMLERQDTMEDVTAVVVEGGDVATTTVQHATAVGSDQATTTPVKKAKTALKRGSITVTFRLEAVSVLEAAEANGILPAAHQTALAMFAEPGGLYLDVKSAYSTAYELQLFVSLLKGLGIYTKAVCSFQPHQLKVGTVADTVLFFHGLAGLENACDNGAVAPGQMALFNGASFLFDVKESSLNSLPEDTTRKMLTTSSCHPVDDMAVKRYISLCERYHVIGGLYVQEPDCDPSSVEALIKLVNSHPDMFPLGFAYGHLNGHAVSFPDMQGRGFATQQILEEMASRKDLSRKTRNLIEAGEHHGASNTTLTVWADRLCNTPGKLSKREQRALLMLLQSVDTDEHLMELLKSVGGIETVIARFHEQYEYTTVLTLLEAGFNFNYTKSLLRLLRNRNVLANLPVPDKIKLANYLTGPKLRGWGLTWLLMALSLRKGLHKHSKEGLLCLFESCTQQEIEAVVPTLKSRRNVDNMLNGWFKLSFSYAKRLKEIDAIHATNPQQLAYCAEGYRYRQLTEFKEKDRTEMRMATHTRDKLPRESAWRGIRKTSCCAWTTFYAFFLEILTAGLFLPCCVCPRFCGNLVHGSCGMPVIASVILGFLIVVLIGVMIPGVWEVQA